MLIGAKIVENYGKNGKYFGKECRIGQEGHQNRSTPPLPQPASELGTSLTYVTD